MKKTFRSRLIIFTFAIALVAGVGAFAEYAEPTAAPTGENAPAPIDIGNSDQIKSGGLSVNAFYVRGGSLFMQDATFKGAVRGGTPSTATSTLNILTGAKVTGNVISNQYINSAAIVPGGSDPMPICSDGSGNIILCN